MDCSLSLNDANYLSRIFTAAAQISTFLVLRSFKIFHGRKYFSFYVWSRWEGTLGVKTCFINWLEYMGHNSRLHFIRTLISTSAWKLYMRINISSSPAGVSHGMGPVPSWAEYIMLAQSVSVSYWQLPQLQSFDCKKFRHDFLMLGTWSL